MIGHIVSGIAGGVAGRHAVNKYNNRNRNPVTQETEPLLGNRLGGRPNVNRLIPSRTAEPRIEPEIQEIVDPKTG